MSCWLSSPPSISPPFCATTLALCITTAIITHPDVHLPFLSSSSVTRVSATAITKPTLPAWLHASCASSPFRLCCFPMSTSCSPYLCIINSDPFSISYFKKVLFVSRGLCRCGCVCVSISIGSLSIDWYRKNLSDAEISGQAIIWRFPTCCGANSSASFLHFLVF